MKRGCGMSFFELVICGEFVICGGPWRVELTLPCRELLFYEAPRKPAT